MTDAAQQISDLETRRRQRCEQSQQKEEPRPIWRSHRRSVCVSRSDDMDLK